MKYVVNKMVKADLKAAQQSLSQKERDYLALGRKQPGGKLPLFDVHGQEINAQIIRGCVEKGLAEPWFANPMKPDWLVCRLTDAGRAAL